MASRNLPRTSGTAILLSLCLAAGATHAATLRFPLPSNSQQFANNPLRPGDARQPSAALQHTALGKGGSGVRGATRMPGHASGMRGSSSARSATRGRISFSKPRMSFHGRHSYDHLTAGYRFQMKRR